MEAICLTVVAQMSHWCDFFWLRGCKKVKRWSSCFNTKANASCRRFPGVGLWGSQGLLGSWLSGVFFLQRFSRFGTSDALGGPRVSLLGSFDGSWQVLGKFLARPWRMPGTFLTGSWVSSALEVSGFMEPNFLAPRWFQHLRELLGIRLEVNCTCGALFYLKVNASCRRPLKNKT